MKGKITENTEWAPDDTLEMAMKAYPNHKLFSLNQIIASTVGLLGVLVFTYELALMIPAWVAVVIFGLVPVVMWPFWRSIAKTCAWPWFQLVKTYSVTIYACFFFLGAMLIDSPNYDYGLSIVLYVLMIINILEAVVLDFQTGSKVNALAGMLVAISTPMWGHAYLSDNGFMYPATVVWIAAYTIWNFGFVYSVSIRIYAHHIAVLLAPLLLFLVHGQDAWFQARVITLALFVFLYNSFFPWFYISYNSERWYSNRIWKMLPVAACLMGGVSAITFMLELVSM